MTLYPSTYLYYPYALQGSPWSLRINPPAYHLAINWLQALNNQNWLMDDEVERSINATKFEIPLPQGVLVATRPQDLFYDDGNRGQAFRSYKDICDRAIEIGFQLCPQLTALWICVGHRDHIWWHDSFWIASSPIQDVEGDEPFIFHVSRNGSGYHLVHSITERNLRKMYDDAEVDENEEAMPTHIPQTFHPKSLLTFLLPNDFDLSIFRKSRQD